MLFRNFRKGRDYILIDFDWIDSCYHHYLPALITFLGALGCVFHFPAQLGFLNHYQVIGFLAALFVVSYIIFSVIGAYLQTKKYNQQNDWLIEHNGQLQYIYRSIRLIDIHKAEKVIEQYHAYQPLVIKKHEKLHIFVPSFYLRMYKQQAS